MRIPKSPDQWDGYFDISAREFCREAAKITGAVVSAIRWIDSALHFLLLDLRGSHWPAGVCISTPLTRPPVSFVAVARDNTMEFYRKHGQAVIGDAESLFGAVRPVRMAKVLSQTSLK